MATIKATTNKPKKHPRRTIDDIKALLRETYQVFTDTEDMMFYRYYINMQGLSSSSLSQWIAKEDQELLDLIQILNDLQESRLWNELIKKNGRVKTTGAIFALKAHHKAVEYERQVHYELERMKIQAGNQPSTDYNININYETIPSRSEDDINKLIDDAKGE
jgi:hypothetical protein